MLEQQNVWEKKNAEEEEKRSKNNHIDNSERFKEQVRNPQSRKSYTIEFLLKNKLFLNFSVWYLNVDQTLRDNKPY